ncbi:MAG: hypothetical protein WC859_08770 [Elusimicrobiota bacterium]|jgi:hypothetical protein
MTVVIPVLLSVLLGPGAGQLYNREYRKGAYLIGLSLIVMVAAIVWFRRAMLPFLPPDLTTLDPAALKQLIGNAVAQVIQGHRGTFLTYEIILMSLWIYSVADAFYGGWRRRVMR